MLLFSLLGVPQSNQFGDYDYHPIHELGITNKPRINKNGVADCLCLADPIIPCQPNNELSVPIGHLDGMETLWESLDEDLLDYSSV
jgi:hypothetical protein